MIAWGYNCINEDILGIYMGFDHQQGYLWDFKQGGTLVRTGEWTPWTSWNIMDFARRCRGRRDTRCWVMHCERISCTAFRLPNAQAPRLALVMVGYGWTAVPGTPNATAFLWGNAARFGFSRQWRPQWKQCWAMLCLGDCTYCWIFGWPSNMGCSRDELKSADAHGARPPREGVDTGDLDLRRF